jgi:predicted Zn-dependent protease
LRLSSCRHNPDLHRVRRRSGAGAQSRRDGQAARSRRSEGADTLGWILYRRGTLQRALDLLSEDASKLPDNPQMQYHLGVVYVKLGDKERAEKALALAVSAPEAFQGKHQARKAREKGDITGPRGPRL